MDSIGVVGLGYVGSSLANTFSKKFIIESYDLNKTSTTSSIKELCSKTKIIFVCVPTPMCKDGSCDTTIVERVCKEIDEHARNHIVVIKSTIVPGTSERISKDLKNSSLLFNPEFLTEANALKDFENQDKIIIGTTNLDEPSSLICKRIYQKVFPLAKIILCSASEAEMLKYFTNTFLAAKVSFANEMYQICKAQDLDYNNIVSLLKLDKRIGQSHLQVPGPMPASDNSGRYLYGFSGSCFVKDINALINHAEQLGVDPKVLKAAWNKNLEVRPERDWECLKGRAVTAED
jgi:UDPglucose 6-dehydrogenase